ncbi:hypothetical protein RCL1_005196 [Eukaryota sp. TZLM3-RCL]
MSLLFSCSVCHGDINLINDHSVTLDDICFSDVLSSSYDESMISNYLESLLDIGETFSKNSKPLSDSQIKSIINGSCSSPVCAACVSNVINSLEKEQQDLQAKLSLYQKASDNLSSLLASSDSSLSSTSSNSEIYNMILADNYSVSVEISQITKEITLLVQDKSKVDNQEAELWKEASKLANQIREMSRDQSIAEQELAILQDQYSRLVDLDPLLLLIDVQVESSRPAATINGNSIGTNFSLDNISESLSIPSNTINWQETNTAMGDLLLLMSVSAKLIDHRFSKLVPIPQGNLSLILKLDDGTYLPFHGPPFSHPLPTNSKKNSKKISLFDEAVMGFVSLITEILDKICSLSRVSHEDSSGPLMDCRNFKLQYPLDLNNWTISHGTNTLPLLLIGQGVSCITDFKGEKCSKWTAAMRLLVLNVLQIVDWCQILSRS